MQLTLYSLNVRGLNDPVKVDRLRGFVRFVKLSPNFFLVQEHKLTGTKAAELGRNLNYQATYFYTEVEPDYNNPRGEPGAGCGGMAVLANPCWKNIFSLRVAFSMGEPLGSCLKISLEVILESLTYTVRMINRKGANSGAQFLTFCQDLAGGSLAVTLTWLSPA